MAILPSPTLALTEQNGISLITDDALFEACGVRIAFAGRAGGVSEGAYASLNTGGNTDDDPMLVMRNRRLLLDAIGAHGEPAIVPKQVHGTRVVRVTQPSDVGRASFEAAEGADAVQVDVEGVPAIINTADCLPLIVVTPSGRFSVVHAGWRGALARIASVAVRSLAEGGEDPSTFNVYIGPYIHAECFEVGEEVEAQFADEFGDDVIVQARHVSLARVVAGDLASVGISSDRIVDCDICTVCHPDEYFSFRFSDGDCGRQATAAYRTRCDASLA